MNDIKWEPISQHFKRLKGSPVTAKLMKEIAKEEGNIRIFAGGDTVVNADYEDIPKGNIIDFPAVLCQSRGIIDFIFYDQPFTFKQEMWAYSNKDTIKTKFLYYYLKNNTEKFRRKASVMGSMPQISTGVTDKFLFPVLKEETQKEIVDILDTFVDLIKTSKTELALREKQFEYYLSAIFSNDVTEKDISLSQIIEPLFGERITKTKNTGTKYPVYGGGGESFRTDKYNRENEIVISRFAISEENVRRVQEKFWLLDSGFTFDIKNDDFLKEYIVYFLFSRQNDIYRCVTGGAQKNLNVKRFLKLKVPFYSIEKQKQIVEFLNSIEELILLLKDKIDLRKKQYEYYRDKLLDFSEEESE